MVWHPSYGYVTPTDLQVCCACCRPAAGFAAELKAKYGKASKVRSLGSRLLFRRMTTNMWGLQKRSASIATHSPNHALALALALCACACLCVWQSGFTHMKRFFASLPLAALVEHSTLIVHGGLFRAPPAKTKAGGKRRRSAGDWLAGLQHGPGRATKHHCFTRASHVHSCLNGWSVKCWLAQLVASLSGVFAAAGAKLDVGTLDDLRKASKGGQDPDPDSE